jgi:hypothetical protein
MEKDDVRKRLISIRKKFGLTLKEAKTWRQTEPDFAKSIVNPLRSKRIRATRLSESPTRKHYLHMNYEFTKEGPIVSGNSTVLSVSECNALLDRYFEHLPKFLRQEKKRKSINIWAGGHLLAVMRACVETYNRMPSENELRRLRTELSRKFDLFYRFTMDLWIRVVGER